MSQAAQDSTLHHHLSERQRHHGYPTWCSRDLGGATHANLQHLTFNTSLDTGQQDILDWLLDSNGLNDKQRRYRAQAMNVDEEPLNDVSQLSDGIVQFDWSEHTVDDVPQACIPDISSEDSSIIDEAISTAANDQQVLVKEQGAYGDWSMTWSWTLKWLADT